MSLILLGMAAMLLGQTPYERPEICSEEIDSAACDAAERARLQALFDIPAMEAEAAAGVVAYRAFIYDDYDRPVVAVSAEARPNEAPKIVVSGQGGARAAAPLSRAAWERVIQDGLLADRDVVPLPQTDTVNGELVQYVCLHPWAATVEMANAPNVREADASVRRKSESACGGDSLTVRHAFLLAEIAIEALPACAALEPDQHRNDARRLAACLSLKGNNLAAAALMNEKGEPPFQNRGDPIDPSAWREWLSAERDAKLDWAGEVHQDSGSSRSSEPRKPRLHEVLVGRLEALPGVRVYQTEFGATDFEHGWITGEIVYDAPADGDPDAQFVANYRQEWTGDGRYWRLASWTVGPFRPLE